MSTWCGWGDANVKDEVHMLGGGTAGTSVSLALETYGGMFDLGPDGYVRALRDDFDAFPPFVTSPTYTTADKELPWLNRAQCLGLGRVDTKAMRIEFDVYAVSLGDRKRAE
jgi:hypothetical protein